MPEGARLRVLVVDDEPLGVRRLLNLLRNEPEIEVVGTAEDGEAAIAAIAELTPDLVFLDIQMPRKTGLDVVQEVGPERMPVTIFVTAYDQFALRAFDLAAVDYLVKPFDNERFAEALRRARRKIELERIGSVQDRLRALLAQVVNLEGAPPQPPAASRYLERIPVHARGKTRVVAVDDIDFITASGVYAELHVGRIEHLVRESLQNLEDRLDPQHFFRIHRSAIVRISLIEALLRGEGGDYKVRLRTGATLKLSRYRRAELEERLGRVR